MFVKIVARAIPNGLVVAKIVMNGIRSSKKFLRQPADLLYHAVVVLY